MRAADRPRDLIFKSYNISFVDFNVEELAELQSKNQCDLQKYRLLDQCDYAASRNNANNAPKSQDTYNEHVNLSDALIKMPSAEEVERVLRSLCTPEMMDNPVYRFQVENALYGGGKSKRH
jgi:hypothetical protein